jgi:hypothetical protein
MGWDGGGEGGEPGEGARARATKRVRNEKGWEGENEKGNRSLRHTVAFPVADFKCS